MRWLARGLACLALGLAIPLALLGRDAVEEPGWAELPNHDLSLDIRHLLKEGRLDEAEGLLLHLAANRDLPGREHLVELEAELAEKQQDWFMAAGRAAKGFVTGRGHSVEALAGAVTSDMMLYGDVRDLTGEGLDVLRGQEADPIIATLAGIGILTEAVDGVDWAPSLLKQYRRIGALHPSFARWLGDAGRRSIRAGRLEPTLGRTLHDTGRLTRRMGIPRSARMFRHVKDPDDLKAVMRAVDLDPDTAYLMMHHGGADGLVLLRRHGGEAAFLGQAQRAVRKGPAGLDLLRRTLRPAVGLQGMRMGARLMKTIRQGRMAALLRALARRDPVVRAVLWSLAAGCLVVAAGCLILAVRPRWLRIPGLAS